MLSVRGTLWALALYDVAEEIRMPELRTLLGVQPDEKSPSFRRPMPEYVRFEQSPVTITLGDLQRTGGVSLQGWIKFFHYGVISVGLTADFDIDLEQLPGVSSRWIGDPELERTALETAQKHAAKAQSAFANPYPRWLSEDYYIIQMQHVLSPDGSPLPLAELLSSYGGILTQVVRGEAEPLSQAEQREALQSSLSYYPNDLLVVGWTAALVYDTAAGALPTIELLDYANAQLLEFRHYDVLLTHVLSGVYRSLERKVGFWRRWGMAKDAERLNTIRLEVIELTERTDNAIKFVSDMFYARAYRVAAEKVGVNDYRRLVDEKLRTAGELYQFMMDQFHQVRAFVLEAMVVVILIIELFFLFRG
jgi:hypothetical protein